MKYTIVVDYGKPFDIKVNSEQELKTELLKLKALAAKGEYPFFDIWVYTDKDIDITESQFIQELILGL